MGSNAHVVVSGSGHMRQPRLQARAKKGRGIICSTRRTPQCGSAPLVLVLGAAAAARTAAVAAPAQAAQHPAVSLRQRAVPPVPHVSRCSSWQPYPMRRVRGVCVGPFSADHRQPLRSTVAGCAIVQPAAGCARVCCSTSMRTIRQSSVGTIAVCTAAATCVAVPAPQR